MKIFSIVGLALAASSLANGLALKGSNARLSVQSQQQEALSPAGLDLQQEEIQQPTPYQFSYDTQSEGGQSTRTESGDATGKVIGQYAIKGADGISRIVSYTADSEGFRANITTNEPGTESQNPSFIVLQSSQLPAAEISRQLQTEADLAQQEEQPLEENAELPQQPAKTLTVAPRKTNAVSKTVARRPAQLPQQQVIRPAQVSVPTKGRRPSQQQQPLAQQAPLAPLKRPASAAPSKGQAIRSRGPSKTVALPSSTTQRPRLVQASPSKRPAQFQQPAALEQAEEQENPSQLADQAEDAVEDESSEGF